ncbi:MAG TPA: EAL domain-containing protein [Solirubrobacteraceae bacterium]|nr:EAL domain-containing protein [Solirubrobacteraceae bacterium]
MRQHPDRLLEPDAPAHVSTRSAGSRRLWMGLAGAILLAGLAMSLASALLWRASVHGHEREAFQTSATDVNRGLETLLRRDSDFVATLRGVLKMEPHMSATRFDRWFATLEGKQRQVGGLGTTVVEVVPARQLAVFQARRDADPAFRAFVGGTIVPVKRARRARYCLLSAGGTVTPYDREVGALVQGDWCDPATPIGGYADAGTSQARLLQSITESGQVLVYPVAVEGVSTLFLEAAFYRPGARLASVAQRRAAVAGWVGSSFQIGALIHQAIAGHRDLGVTLYHSNPGRPANLIAQVGARRSPGALTHTTTMQIDGSWTAVAYGSAVTSGPSTNLQGLLVALAGTIVSVLLFVLVLVLSRSRERALGMVRAKTAELRHLALHDPLTGLPNRVLALDRAEQMLARARRQQVPVAALYLDIDGFKHVNDTFGHAAGDELLRMVASRLASAVREGDTAARLGGDEFVVLVEGSALDAGPELVAERLLDVLRQPYDINGEVGRRLSVTASVGVALGQRDSADRLLRDADLALYEAKAAGRSRYTIFTSGMQTIAKDRLTLEMDLAEALTSEQLFLVYQPTFELQSQRVIGVEALIRWRHTTRGLIAPLDFIPLAEQSGLIVPIGRWVLDEACRQAAAWWRHGHEIGVSVNVSGRQLDSDELIEDVCRALDESALDPVALTLEITETTLMRDVQAAATRLRELKQLGVRIAIDDFGTGYSSLAYLRQLPADALKIDRSFVSGIADSNDSAAVIRTLVALGKALHIETLAEGIEQDAQLKTLQREHCDHGQGFLFSRPLDADAVEQFLDAAGSKRSSLAAR